MQSQTWPKVQLALDLVNLSSALRIAKIASSEGVDWLEAGTPLIKSTGMRAIRSLRRTFPHNSVVADMKTLDAGTIEADMAFQAGAKVVSISGLAHDTTVRDAVRSSRAGSGWIMADLLMSTNPLTRAKQLEDLGVDIICIHTGIDAQKTLHSRLKISRTVREILRKLRIPVAAAGGIDPDIAEALVKLGASVIIVGGWITGAKDPARAARQIVKKVVSAQEP